MPEFIPPNPAGAFDPHPGDTVAYQPPGDAPELVYLVSLSRAGNRALVRFPHSAEPYRAQIVRLDHLKERPR